MFAITLHQPWASLIIAGFKPYEFRSWSAPVHVWFTRIAIHAGKKRINLAEVQEVAEFPHYFKLWHGAEALLKGFITTPETVPYGVVLGTALMKQPQRCVDLWPDSEPSQWAWPLSSIEAFTPPVPARGQQGFWEYGVDSAATTP